MSQELAQWVAEIRGLKQQLAEQQRELDTANESAANWRQRYTTEAEQRRTDTRLAQQQIDTLKAQIRELQTPLRQGSDDPALLEAVQQQVEQLQTVEALKAKLQEVLMERDRLLEALKAEQTNHAQTRKSLTTVIGDTIDKLTKEKQK
jgi:chromosome segregation ATPase